MRKYTWRPDVPDHRDHIFSAPLSKKANSIVDLRAFCPRIYDQGDLGSCTANAIAAAMEFDLKLVKHDVMLSRLFIYYNERVLEHSVKSDSGASLRDGIKAISTWGAPPEAEWPYSDKDPGPFEIKPTAKAYADGLKHRVQSYQRVPQTLSQMKSCLVAGYPFVFGFAVYDSFESEEVAKTGIVNMPAADENFLGGHAVLCVGYNDAEQRFIVRNSWGVDWGMKGYFTIPYAYLLDPNLADDFWTIRALLA